MSSRPTMELLYTKTPRLSQCKSLRPMKTTPMKKVPSSRWRVLRVSHLKKAEKRRKKVKHKSREGPRLQSST